MYLISDVHWYIFLTDALKDDAKISITSSFKELFNIFSLKETDIYSESNIYVL